MDSIIIFSILGIGLLIFLSQQSFINSWREHTVKTKNESMTREYFEGLDKQIESDYEKTNVLREF